MIKPRSLLAKLAVACVLVLASAVPVFAANLPATSNNNGDAGGTTVTAAKPPGLADGDVMIASVAFRINTATITPPLGWNLIAKGITTSGDDTALATYWKLADGTDVLATDFTWTGLAAGTRAFAGIARYDDVNAPIAGTPIAANVTNPTPDGGNQDQNTLTANSVTTTQPGSYVTAIYGVGDVHNITTGPAGMTELYNNLRSTGTTGTGRLLGYDVSQAAAGASLAKTVALGSGGSGNAEYVSQTIALKPKPTKLGFSTSPHTGVVDQCIGPITVQTQNTAGVAVNPLSSTQVNLATNETGSFFTDSSCATTAVTNGTIGTGDTGLTFYYKPTARGSGSHQITATDNAAVLTQAQQTQTVKLAQTITFAQPTTPQIYGDDFDIGSATSDAVGDYPVTVTPTGGCTLVGTTATVTSATTDCTLTATQDGDSTYAAATPVVRTVVTDPRPVTVTPDSGQSKVYNNGASNPTYTYDITSGDLVGTDDFTGALSRVAGENVSTSPYEITQDTLSLGTNYALTVASGVTFAITPKELAMNGNNASKTYGEDDPAFSATLTGLAPGHNNRNQAGITGTETCTRSNPTVQNVGVYNDVISCTQGTLTAANGNYSFATGTSGDFTIDPKQLSVTADPASKTYGDADPTFTATLAGFAFSENPTSANVTGAAACLRTGTDEDVATYPGVITCTTGNLAAPNYTFAVAGPASDFTINKRTAHVTSTVADKVYNQSTAAQILTSVLTNVVSGDDLNFTGTPSAEFLTASAGQNKAVDVSGALTLGGTDEPNYDLAIDDTTADITPKQLTPSFTAASKAYDGGTAATVTGRSVTGVLSPDAVSLTGGSATFASKTVANGKTVTLAGATLSGAQAGNYSLPGANPTTTANITQKSVTGGFTAADKDFDGTNAATITGRSLTGAVAGDSVSLAGGTATFNNANPGVDKPVTGTGFSLAGADAGNYTLGSVGATTADIRQRDPGEAPAGQQKSPAEKAADLLGGDVKVLDLGLGSVGFAFAPKSQGKSIKPINQKLFAIGGCSVPCTVAAAKTLVLTTGDASAAATKKIKLKTQKLSLGANQLGVVKLKLTKKQKRKIKKAEKAKLVVKVTLKAGAQTVSGKKTYRFKKP